MTLPSQHTMAKHTLAEHKMAHHLPSQHTLAEHFTPEGIREVERQYAIESGPDEPRDNLDAPEPTDYGPGKVYKMRRHDRFLVGGLVIRVVELRGDHVKIAVEQGERELDWDEADAFFRGIKLGA